MTGLQNMFEGLILAMLMTGQSGKWTRMKIVKHGSLRRLFANHWQDTKFDSAADAAITRLAGEGLLRHVRKSGVAITDSGRRRVSQLLGFAKFPRKLGWNTQIVRGHLPAIALGMAPPIDEMALRGLAKVESLAAELLRLRFGLSAESAFSPRAVRNELGWNLLSRGMDAELIEAARRSATFTAANVADALMCAAAGKEMQARWGQKILVAHELGLTDAGAGAIYLELGRRAIEGRGLDPPARAAEGVPLIDESEFASRVRRAAESIEEERVGDQLVFVSHAWRKFVESGNDMPLELFKQKLVDAHRSDRIMLAKADLPRFLNRKDLDESRIIDRNTVFTFIRI